MFQLTPFSGRYGVEKELLYVVSCGCGNGNEECFDELTTLNGNIFGFFTYVFFFPKNPVAYFFPGSSLTTCLALVKESHLLAPSSASTSK